MGYYKNLSISKGTKSHGSSVYIKGIDGIERAANKLLQSVNMRQQMVIEAASKKLRQRLKENAPVGTKQKNENKKIRNATYAKVLPETTSHPVVGFVGIRPRKAHHAHLVEYGHGGPHPAPPHPFVQKTWDENKEAIIRDIQNGIIDAVGKGL